MASAASRVTPPIIIHLSLEQLIELPSTKFEPSMSKIEASCKELVLPWRVTNDQYRLDLNTVYMTRMKELGEVTFYLFRPVKKEEAPAFLGDGKFEVILSELGIRVQCIVPVQCNGSQEIEQLSKIELDFLKITLIFELVRSYINFHEIIRDYFVRQHWIKKLPGILEPKPPFSAWQHRIDIHPFHIVVLPSQNPNK